MDIITGFDGAGNPVTHLVLFSPLISPGSGRSRFMLAALVDTTAFLEETAALPALDAISEESSVASLAEVIGTPSGHASPGWKPVSHELSVEDLLGGCSLSDDPPLKSGGLAQDDIWLDLAMSEKQGREAARYNSRSRQRRHLPPTPSSTGTHSTARSVDDVDTFVSSLQTLYSDFFILGKNALDDNCYEICNISPSVYDAKEYIDGHLSRTPRETLDNLSNNLTRDEPFSLNVHWGNAGVPKTLYCSPMYGQRSVTWICFLVDPQIPLLW